MMDEGSFLESNFLAYILFWDLLSNNMESYALIGVKFYEREST